MPNKRMQATGYRPCLILDVLPTPMTTPDPSWSLAIWTWQQLAKCQQFITFSLKRLYPVLRVFKIAAELEEAKLIRASDQSQISSLQQKVKDLQGTNDLMAARLEPPARRHELEDRLLVLAATERRVRSGTLARLHGVHWVTSKFHFHELVTAGYLEPLDTDFHRLSHQGIAYLVRYDLVPPVANKAVVITTAQPKSLGLASMPLDRARMN